MSVLALWLALVPATGIAETWTLPIWKIGLGTQFEIKDSVAETYPNWQTQKGLAFINPQMLAVYFVRTNEIGSALENRQMSGGGGKFILHVMFFRVSDGIFLKELSFVTNSELSSVMSGSNDHFFIRAGDVVHVLSTDLKEIQTLQLSLTRTARNELWSTETSPSGSQLWILRRANSGFGDVHGRAEVRVLDIMTLEPKAILSAEVVNNWSVGDDFCTMSNPTTGMGNGILRTDGSWKPVQFPGEGEQCVTRAYALPNRMWAGLGCSVLTVFDIDGDKSFSEQAGKKEVFKSVTGKGHFLAVEIDRRFGNPFDSAIRVRPTKVAVYDINRKTLSALVSLKSKRVWFAISESGTLAVIDDEMLEIFRINDK